MVCKICNESDHIAKTCLGEYEGIRRIEYEKQECSICLTTIKKPICKTKCNHFFHITCVKEWMKNKANCPLCRTTLREEDNLIETIVNELLSNIIDDLDSLPNSVTFYFEESLYFI